MVPCQLCTGELAAAMADTTHTHTHTEMKAHEHMHRSSEIPRGRGICTGSLLNTQTHTYDMLASHADTQS